MSVRPRSVTVPAMTDPWDAAFGAAASAGVRLIELDALRDADAVNGVVGRVWGDQPLSREVLRALQHAGCALYGAWEAGLSPPGDGRSGADGLVGYVLGFVGVANGPHVHSHMLAVVPGWRSRGVGFALKLAQRAWALDHGLGEIRWTYDPLLLGNARFNLQRLGAVAERYLPDFYGPMRDDLNRGERTDRFDVSWMLSSERVETAIASAAGSEPLRPPDDAADVLIAAPAEAGGDRSEPILSGRPRGDRALVAIPHDHLALRRSNPELARRWRGASGEAFGMCFDAGLVASGITADARYLFEPPPGAGVP
jgi:predicted GNAT superfamily acetyltransferase